MLSKRIIYAMVLLTFVLLSSTLTILGVNGVINPDFIYPRNEYKYGGIFNYPVTNDFPNLNPFLGTGATWLATISMYESLIMIDPYWQPVPWLAKSWDISADGLTYTFYLQENVTWSDGVPLTSEDVKFTFDGWKKHNLAQMLAYTNNINSIETPDPYTVVMKLTQKDVTFIPFAMCFPSLVIVPKHIWEKVDNWATFVNDDPELAVGSGPFKLKEWKKGEYLKLVANENYWQGRPYIDGITFIVIKLRDIQLMALEKGEVDICTTIFGSDVPKFLNPEKYYIYQIVDAGVPWFYANCRIRPGNDTQFRYAMQYMVDRDKLLNMAHFGYGVKPHHILPPPYEIGEWVPPEDITKPFNLTKAGEILDKAGYKDVDGDGWREYPNGDKMEPKFAVSDFERYMKAGEIIVDAMRKVGINIKLDVIGGGMWATKVMINKDFDFTYWRCGPGGGDPLEPLQWFVSYSQGWIGWVNTTYDALWEKAASISDPDERRPYIWQLQRILAENYVFVPHVSNINLKVLRSDKFDPLPNSLPWGPWSNAQMWHYFNIHLKGPAAAAKTILSVDVASTAELKEPVQISATLKDEGGTPLKGMYIDFYAHDYYLGATTTNEQGVAVFTWIPLEAGTMDVRSVFSGTPEYQRFECAPKTVTNRCSPASPAPITSSTA